MHSRLFRAVIVLCLAVVGVACTKSLDMGGLETQLADQINTKLDRTGITVDCPDDVKAESGGEFDCTGTVPQEGTLTIHVKQTDADGHVTWEIVDVATGPTGTSGATGASGPTGTT
jgi:hypothetical protein